MLLIMRRRAARTARHGWEANTTSALRDAELTRDMLVGEARPDQPEDPARQEAVRSNVERVASRFEQLAAGAPDETTHRNTLAVATSLRGYLFALEAERLLRAAPTPPTAEQLATADSARRARATDLDAGLDALRASVEPKDTTGP
ncbi:MAG TPA: hypothetical protein VN636_19765 [Acidimicrobiia bacterium]|nr:hypothetical protein [Acidimicrobiia bacterium]